MWGIILVWTLKFEPCPNDGQNHFPKSIIFFLTFGSETFREFLRKHKPYENFPENQTFWENLFYASEWQYRPNLGLKYESSSFKVSEIKLHIYDSSLWRHQYAHL